MSGWAKFTIGSFALLFAWIFFISRHGSASHVLSWVLIGFCVLIALACFSRTARTPALRLIGAAIFVAYAFYLVSELRRGTFRLYSGALEGFFVFGLPGLYLALRGIYPSWGRGASVFRGDSEPHSPEHEQDQDNLD